MNTANSRPDQNVKIVFNFFVIFLLVHCLVYRKGRKINVIRLMKNKK